MRTSHACFSTLLAPRRLSFALSTFYSLAWLRLCDFAPLRELFFGSLSDFQQYTDKIAPFLGNIQTKSRFYQNRAGHFRAFSGIKMGNMGNISFVFGSISPLLPEKILRPLPPTGHSGHSGHFPAIRAILLNLACVFRVLHSSNGLTVNARRSRKNQEKISSLSRPSRPRG